MRPSRGWAERAAARQPPDPHARLPHWAVTWVLTILGIVALIVLHEFGHFLAAKAVGMRVERFSLFFPPTLFRCAGARRSTRSARSRAGGYVKITGMSPEELEGLDPEVPRRAYYNQAPWKRIVVILAGPGVNIADRVRAVLGGAVHGQPQRRDLARQPRPVGADARGDHLRAGSAAEEPAAGVLHKGDRIVAVEGKPASVDQPSRASRPPLRGALDGLPGEHARAPDRVAGRDLTLSLYPRYDAALNGCSSASTSARRSNHSARSPPPARR